MLFIERRASSLSLLTGQESPRKANSNIPMTYPSLDNVPLPSLASLLSHAYMLSLCSRCHHFGIASSEHPSSSSHTLDVPHSPQKFAPVYLLCALANPCGHCLPSPTLPERM